MYNFRRLLSVVGSAGKENNLIYCRKPSDAIRKTVLFFGGDLQDFEENMKVHCKRYSHWNLDATARLLANSFPNCDVLVVQPSHMHNNTFSVYSNFVESDKMGSPSYHSHDLGIAHLCKLLLNCHEKLLTENLCELKLLRERSLCIIGFSKGCVVLNQLLHEMHSNRLKLETQNFIKTIKEIFWLDAGHNGESDVWITDQEILRSLARFDIEVQVHVTPCQMEDCRRPWIKKQKEIFVSSLEKYGCKLTNKYHFQDKLSNLENHFQLLNVFTTTL